MIPVQQIHHRKNRRRKWARQAASIAAALALTVGISSCMTMGALGTKDAAGMTQSEVEALGPEGRFNLVGERYERMQELMTEAQPQVSGEPWEWGAPGFLPGGGPTDWHRLADATYDNSYYLDLQRSFNPTGAVGDIADTRSVYDYFVSKGWEVSLTENGFSELELETTRDFRVQALTEDGYRIEYTVQQNGQYNLEILAGVFWGDSDAILKDIFDRLPKDKVFPRNKMTELGWTLPGVYTDFPEWSDPIIRERDE